jgi:hypothetical protein
MKTLLALALALSSESWAALPLDSGDYQASERCAMIEKTIKLQPSVKINKDDPTLNQCSQAKIKDVCQQAKRSLDQSAANRGKMPACKGVEVADAHVIKINITNPTTGEKTFYNSVGGSLSAARANADANFNYLKAHGWKPVFDLGN